MRRQGRIRIGCSGWQYASWRGPFYPSTLPVHEWLSRYTAEFDTVEVNNTFYRLPPAETFSAWRAGTPPGFVIAVKASRYLTHLKQLRDPGPPLALLFQRALALGPRLGPVLYQLPARVRYDEARLRTFLDALPRSPRDLPTPDPPPARPWPRLRLRHVIEFRDPSWYRDDVFRWLDAAGVALCLHDRRGSAIVEPRVGPFLYVRFHGTSGAYAGSYTRAALRRWAQRLEDAAAGGRDAYAYFNNDPGASAVRNARTLKDLLAS